MAGKNGSIDPNHDKVAALYDSMAGSYDNIDEDSFYRNQYAQYERHLMHHLARLEGKKVLDIGCGTGIQMVELAPRVATITGIDISPRLLEVARAKLSSSSNTSLLEADATALPFDDDTFDAVISYGETLSHLVDYRKGFSEAIRVLGPGGLFIFSVLNKWNLSLAYSPRELADAVINSEGHRRRWICEDDSGNPTRLDLKTFTRRELDRMGAEMGFEITGATGIHVCSLGIPLFLQRQHLRPIEMVYRLLGTLDRRLVETAPFTGFGYTCIYTAEKRS